MHATRHRLRSRDLASIAREHARPRAMPALAIGAQALGAVAIGTVALGAIAVAALAIGRLAVGKARVRRLYIDELVVGRVRVLEQLSLPSERAADSASDGAPG